MRIIKDANGNQLKDGDVIDIRQTVNGQRVFVIETVEPLDIRYGHDLDRLYEYDKEELLKPDSFTGETDFVILGHKDQISYDDVKNMLGHPMPAGDPVLKPCPFCGSKDVSFETFGFQESMHQDTIQGAVKCSDCDACGPQETICITYKGGQGDVTDYAPYKATAIKAWNNRK